MGASSQLSLCYNNIGVNTYSTGSPAWAYQTESCAVIDDHSTVARVTMFFTIGIFLCCVVGWCGWRVKMYHEEQSQLAMTGIDLSKANKLQAHEPVPYGIVHHNSDFLLVFRTVSAV